VNQKIARKANFPTTCSHRRASNFLHFFVAEKRVPSGSDFPSEKS
jgi:hypothetical protein